MNALPNERVTNSCGNCHRPLDVGWEWWTRDGANFCSIPCYMDRIEEVS